MMRNQTATGIEGRVLVVDDSLVVRRGVSDILRNAGYTVQEAGDGRAALACLDAEEFDVVLTDLRMPELDGFGVLQDVKRRSLTTEVIILTGTHAKDVDCAVRALRLGAHDFLTKPPSGPDEVILTVDRALEKKRLKESNLRLLRELEAMSRTDPLTGALNRRAFDESLRREVSRARRYDFPLAIMMIDIDHFKLINDAHGHLVGDEVLKAFVRIAGEALRDSDALHRYGGEEFAALLPHCTIEGALLAAERLVATVAATPLRVGRETQAITVSAGVAAAQGRDLDRLDLLALADAAVYKAKQDGRNRALSTDALSQGCH